MATKTTNSKQSLRPNGLNPIMEELLASQSKKIVNIYRGQEVEGEVVSISEKEIILDLGAKSEGVISKREFSEPQLKDLKVGSKLKAFVYIQENESGQVVLSLQRSMDFARDKESRHRSGKGRGGRFMDWSKFISAQNQKAKLQGSVIEVNKGGLMVEVDGTRGFLPNSQVGFELLSKSGDGLDSLIGQKLSLTVIEVDPDNNKLIFSERGQVSPEVQEKLKSFKKGQKAAGKIVAILPFGLVVDTAGSEGLVFISDVSWEKIEDLNKLYKVGDEVEVVVTGFDQDLGRLNLSIKELSEDPFAKLGEKYPADEVVKGEIISVTDAGVAVRLDGVEGFLPAAKMDPDTKYEPGNTVTLLVDSVDTQKRRVNLAPFVTSTAGLIYK